MTVETGRGAQTTIIGDARKSARGAYGATRELNEAQIKTMYLAGTAGDGSTANGASLTGVAPLDPMYSNADALGGQIELVSNTLTAHAGGTQAAALALVSGINRVTVCATNADSVRLPTMVAGQTVWVINSGAATLQVYGAGTATINDVATATGVSLATTKVGVYKAVTAGLIYGGALA